MSRGPFGLDSLREDVGNKVDKISGKGLSTNDLTNDLLEEIRKVENKVDKEEGKGLSTHDYDDIAKESVDNMGTAASRNVTESATDTTAGRLIKVGDNVDILGDSKRRVLLPYILAANPADPATARCARIETKVVATPTKGCSLEIDFTDTVYTEFAKIHITWYSTTGTNLVNPWCKTDSRTLSGVRIAAENGVWVVYLNYPLGYFRHIGVTYPRLNRFGLYSRPLPEYDHAAVTYETQESTAGIGVIITRAYNQRNAVGAVSQVGGHTTGGLMQHGETPNGRFWRYANNHQVCTGIVVLQLPINIATGSGFQSLPTELFSFAAPFAATPELASSTRYVTGGARAWESITTINNNGVGLILHSFSAVSDTNVRVSYTAKGPWY